MTNQNGDVPEVLCESQNMRKLFLEYVPKSPVSNCSSTLFTPEVGDRPEVSHIPNPAQIPDKLAQTETFSEQDEEGHGLNRKSY
jgi:hypothetical protein